MIRKLTGIWKYEDSMKKINPGDTVECPYCGIELIYKGEDKFEVVEEEK